MSDRKTKDLDVSTLEGFKKIYDAHWEKVYAVCFNNTRDVELSQDMTQAIFKSLWERKDSLTIEKSIEHYLVRAAKLKVAENYRNRSIREKHLKCISRDYCKSAQCTKQDVNYSLLVQKLDLLVDELPCRCQEVFRLSREEGLTNKNIARKLDISQRAVEYHISKALNYLKEEMPEYNLS